MSSVTGTVNGVANPSYGYDANGNITASAGRTVSWMSFNLPASVTRGANALGWAYDSEHQRVREQLRVNGALMRTTVYINPAEGEGLYYEEEIANGVLKRRHYIAGAEGTVAVLTRQAGAADEVRYWHKDHLGSTQVVTNESGAVVERLAYEPFGKRRNADGTTDAAGTLTPISTDRGFTGHEMLDEVGLVHMNGRIYDAAIGRFLSADPSVPHPLDLQSYNRYSYARNNPLSLVDPSGFADEYFDTGYGCSFGTYSYGYRYDAPSTYNWAGSGVGTLGGATYGSGLSMYYDPLGIRSSGGVNITAAPVVGMAEVGEGGFRFGPRRSILDGGPPNTLGESFGVGLYGATVGMAKELGSQYGDVWGYLSQGTKYRPQSGLGSYAASGGSAGSYYLGLLTGPIEGGVDVTMSALTGNFERVAEAAGPAMIGMALRTKGAGPAFKDFNQARNAAVEWLDVRGFKAEQATLGKFGDNAGKPIGMKTVDGSVGFRVEYDARNGAHINVWAGKEKGPHFTFQGNQSAVDQIVKQFVK